MDNKQKQYLKKVDYNFLTTLFLTAGDGYGQSTDFKPLRNLFGFFTGKDYLKETLKQLIIVFSSVGQGFGEIETILGHHIIENKTKIPYNATGVKKQKRLGLAKPDKEDCIPNKETLKMSMLVYNTFKSRCRLWRESEIAPYIRILMRTLSHEGETSFFLPLTFKVEHQIWFVAFYLTCATDTSLPTLFSLSKPRTETNLHHDAFVAELQRSLGFGFVSICIQKH